MPNHEGQKPVLLPRSTVADVEEDGPEEGEEEAEAAGALDDAGITDADERAWVGASSTMWAVMTCSDGWEAGAASAATADWATPTTDSSAIFSSKSPSIGSAMRTSSEGTDCNGAAKIHHDKTSRNPAEPRGRAVEDDDSGGVAIDSLTKFVRVPGDLR